MICALGTWESIEVINSSPNVMWMNRMRGQSQITQTCLNIFGFRLWTLFLHLSNFIIVICAEQNCIQLKSLWSLIGPLCSKKLKPAANWPQVHELSVGNDYYVTLIYFLFLIITNTYCGLLDYGRSYAHLFYSFYLEIRSVKCSP